MFWKQSKKSSHLVNSITVRFDQLQGDNLKWLVPNCKFPFLPTIHNLDWHSHIDHALPLVVLVESCIYVVVLYEVFIHEIWLHNMQFNPVVWLHTICSLSLSRVVSKRWQFYCPGPSRLPSPLDQTTVNLICFCLIDLMILIYLVIFNWSDYFELFWWFSIDQMIFPLSVKLVPFLSDK